MAHKRDLQLANMIRKHLGEYCLNDLEMREIIICDVVMRDKKCAEIIYTPVEESIDYDNLLILQKKLEKISPKIRHYIAKNTVLKYTPTIVFTPTLTPQEL